LTVRKDSPYNHNLQLEGVRKRRAMDDLPVPFIYDQYSTISKDLLVKVRLQNNRIWTLVKNKWGNINQSELARRTGIDASTVGGLLNFKKDLITKSAKHRGHKNKPVIGYEGLYWIKSAGLLAEALGVLPEDLFPEEFRSPKQNYYELEVSKSEALAFANVHTLPESPEELLLKEEDKYYLKMALGGLDYRYQYILRNRFGLDGLEDDPISLECLAQKMDITKERVRQIEREGLEKLKRAYLRERAEVDRPDGEIFIVPPEMEDIQMKEQVAALEKEVKRLGRELREQTYKTSSIEKTIRQLTASREYLHEYVTEQAKVVRGLDKGLILLEKSTRYLMRTDRRLQADLNAQARILGRHRHTYRYAHSARKSGISSWTGPNFRIPDNPRRTKPETTKESQDEKT